MLLLKFVTVISEQKLHWTHTYTAIFPRSRVVIQKHSKNLGSTNKVPGSNFRQSLTYLTHKPRVVSKSIIKPLPRQIMGILVAVTKMSAKQQ